MEVKRNAIAQQENLQLLFEAATDAMKAYKGEDVAPRGEYYDD
jgi:hypothetical protein